MGSDKVDKWVEKDPESWSKIANIKNKKITFAKFKKEFKKGAKENGKYNAIKNMTEAQLKKIYLASGNAKTGAGATPIKPDEKPFKPKKVTVERKGKTYKRTFAGRWEKSTKLSLTIVAELKPRTPEYNRYVANLVESTGRSRQAVIKKIYRTRKGL